MSTVMATVNAQEITEKELTDMTNAYMQQTQKQEVSDEERKMLLENLIENKLLQEEAVARNLEVTDEILDQQLQQFYSQYGGEEQLKKMLEMQDMKIEDIIENIKIDLLGQLTAKDEVDQKLDVSDAVLTAFYEENKESIVTQSQFRASHILFKNEDEGFKETAEKVLAEIKEGGDFAKLAEEYSACPSKASGGDLNFFGKGQMVPEFENAVTSMATDDVSDLVETQFGIHIIKKTGETEGKQLSFDEAKSQIKDVISREKGQEIIQELVGNLREKFSVVYAS